MSGSGCTWLFVPGQGVMDSVSSFSLKENGKRGEKLLKDGSQKEPNPCLANERKDMERQIQFSVIPKMPKCEGTKVNHGMF